MSDLNKVTTKTESWSDAVDEEELLSKMSVMRLTLATSDDAAAAGTGTGTENAKEIDPIKVTITDDTSAKEETKDITVKEPKTEDPATPATDAAAGNEELKDGDGAQEEEDEGKEEEGGQQEAFTDLLDNIKTEVEVQLADLQADPNNPLYSAKNFEDLGLPEILLKGLYDMKFKKPSKIQEKALPLLLADPPRNMIGQSQSGTGKTAAFVLTMLKRVDPTLNVTQAICVAPARELAKQIMDVVETMGKYTTITTKFVSKEMPNERSRRPISEQIVVGTPGKVNELLEKRQLRTEHVKVLVLDEADNMLDSQGMGDQSLRIRIKMPKTCQVLLFSATFPPQVENFAQRFAPEANVIRLRTEELTVDAIKQYYIDSTTLKDKYSLLLALYGLLTVSQSIIFVQRRDTADQIAKRMQEQNHNVISLHGQQDPDVRDRNMDKFRKGEAKVLISTNVIARGIDISQVTLVINYDLPLLPQSRAPDMETYLHRIGRTGRFGRTGSCINFVHSKAELEKLREIEEYFGKKIVQLPADDLDALEKTLKSKMK